MKWIVIGVPGALVLMFLLAGCLYESESATWNARSADLRAGAEGNLIPSQTPATKSKAVEHPSRSAIEEFHQAVRTNNLTVVRRLAEADRRLLSEGSPWKDPLQGMTPLYSAIDAGNLEMVKLLISCGADIKGAPIIERASKLVDSRALQAINEEVRHLIMGATNSTPDLTGVWGSRFTDIVKTQRNGLGNRIEILRCLLEPGANLNTVAPDLKTVPLANATIYACDGQGVELLLRHGANPNASSYVGNTPLHMAAVVGNVGALRALVAGHADLELKNASGRTALMIASALGHVEAVRALLELGASIRTRSRDGWNAIFFAVDERQDNIFKMLVAKGAVCEDFISPRQSVLNLGCMEGSRLVVEAALASGVDKEFADYEGFTPFLCAVENGHLEIAQILLARGVNPKARTKNGYNAVHLAAGTGNLELLQTVVSLGLEVDPANATTLSCSLGNAAQKGYVDVIKYLLEKGAKADRPGRYWQPLHAVALGPQSLAKETEHSRNAVCRKPAGTEDDYVASAELLLACGADINARAATGATPLSLALRYGFHRMADLLIAKGAALDGRAVNGQTLLHMACQGGNKKVAELLLAKGATIEACDNDGATPLHVAADYGRLELVELLLSRQAKLGAKTNYGSTALHYAAQGHQGNPDEPPPEADYAAVAGMLIRHGADVRAVASSRGAQPLHMAAVSGNMPVVRVLLDHGALLDVPDNYGQTPFLIACGGGWTDIAKLLLKRGANYKLRTGGGEAALHQAAASGNLELVSLLLSLGLDVNDDGAEPGCTPLCYAAQYGRLEVAKYLIAKGAKAEPVTSQPPLIKVAFGPDAFKVMYKARFPESKPVQTGTVYEYLEIAKLLIANGANIDVASKDGWTPFLAALSFGFSDMVDLLIEQGAELKVPRGARYTLLHTACRGGNQKIVKMLLSKGVDIAALDADGFLPLHTAADNGRPALIELLLAQGLKVGVKTFDGRTPLHLVSQGRVSVRNRMVYPPLDADYAGAAEVLIRHGADVRAIAGGSEQPLHTAAQAGNTPVAKILLEHGAPVDSVDQDGNTPLALAILHKRLAVATLLVARHANVNHVTTDGLSLLELATGKGLSELVTLMQQNGASSKSLPVVLPAGDKGSTQVPQAERAAESVEDAEKALAAAERNFGADAPGVVVYLCRVADAYLKKGKASLAALLYRRALSIAEKAPGVEPSEVAALLRKQAAAYRLTGFNEKEAAELEERAALIKESKP
jgi:ankyrin repeat protein